MYDFDFIYSFSYVISIPSKFYQASSEYTFVIILVVCYN